jgi:hypothetical protein
MTVEEKKEYRRNYYLKNKEWKLSYAKKYKEENFDKIAEYQKKYTLENTDIRKNYKSKYRDENKERISSYNKEYLSRSETKERVRNVRKTRMEMDPIYSLKERIRSRIKSSLYLHGYKKNSSTEKILGCSFLEFKEYIFSKFTDGMSWENRDKWHIDHIIPISHAKTEDEVIKLNHFSNLQPLWSVDNLQKGNSIRLHELIGLSGDVKELGVKYFEIKNNEEVCQTI